MAQKISARQQAQLAYLDQLTPRLQRIQALIERLNSPSEADTAARQLARMLDEVKIGAAGLSLSGIADSAASMASLARRTGGLQVRLRGLREGFVSMKINYDGARKAATRAEEEPDDAAG